MYRDNVGSVAGEIDIPFVGTVTSVLPGRPNFSVSDDNGTLMVSENDFTNETVGKVESVGYIENGEVTMRMILSIIYSRSVRLSSGISMVIIKIHVSR